MPNITITNLNVGNVILDSGEFRDNLLTLAGAGTVLSGTILARDSVSLKLVPYVKGGTTTGNGIPKAVLTYDVVSTAAGDVPVRAMVSGCVRAEMLIIDADGDASNIDAAVLDELRSYSLISTDVQNLSVLDNQ